MIIKTWRNPYGNGTNLTKPEEISFNPGITVLAGCNGIGKTTMLNNIKHECKNNKIPCHMFNNLSEGGSSLISNSLFNKNYELMATAIKSSEGEQIMLALSNQSSLYKEFLHSGRFKDRTYNFSVIFNEELKQSSNSNIRVLLYDATDSGLSIDNIIELKKLFHLIISDASASNIELYIIISSNEYELCSGEQCYDTVNGEYITFSDYNDYKSFILKTAKLKKKRIQKEIDIDKKLREKNRIKYTKLEEKVNKKIEAIKSKSEPLTRGDKLKIDDEERKLRNFKENNKM